jgi:hypothetical protein
MRNAEMGEWCGAPMHALTKRADEADAVDEAEESALRTVVVHDVATEGQVEGGGTGGGGAKEGDVRVWGGLNHLKRSVNRGQQMGQRRWGKGLHADDPKRSLDGYTNDDQNRGAHR